MQTHGLAGKIAIVTGGARGIGRAICERYAAEGAKVVVADVRYLEAAKLAAELGPKHLPVQLDVTSRESIEQMIQSVTATFGAINILVNNAGVFDMSPLVETTEESFDRVFSVNVRGMFFTLKAVAAIMLKQKQPGKVINIASESGRRGEPMIAAYCASKAAVISITQSAGLELIKRGIHVNAISPGVVDTPMWDVVDALYAKYENRPVGEKKLLVGKAVPFGRMAVPGDYAGAAVFLASPESDYIVGQTLNVDGGNCLN